MVKIYPMIHPVVIPIIDCYPESKDIVYDIFREEESFREICQDYEQCRKALLYWSKHNSEEAILLTAEYKEILRSLEQELMRYITEYEENEIVEGKRSTK